MAIDGDDCRTQFKPNHRVCCKAYLNNYQAVENIISNSKYGPYCTDIQSSLDDKRNSCYFNELFLTQIANDSNMLNLEFYVKDILSDSIVSNISNYSVSIHLTSDKIKADRIEDIQNRINQIKEYNKNIKSLEEQKSKINDKINSICMSGRIRIDSSLNDDEQINECAINNNQLLSQQNDMNNQSHNARRAKSRSNLKSLPNLSNSKAPYGYLYDLAFVDDEDEAKLISWAAQSFHDAIIVENLDDALELYHKGFKSWAIEDCQEYR